MEEAKRCQDVEITRLPDDLAERMRSGRLPFLIGIDSKSQVSVFYVEGNEPNPPGCEADREVLRTLQLRIETCGCVNKRLRHLLNMLGIEICFNTDIRC
jgi:hypothetical protein